MSKELSKEQKDSINAEIKKCIPIYVNGKLNDVEIKPDSLLKEDLGLDSLHAVEITIEIEKKFDISIPDHEIENAKTVKDFYDVTEKLLN